MDQISSWNGVPIGAMALLEVATAQRDDIITGWLSADEVARATHKAEKSNAIGVLVQVTDAHVYLAMSVTTDGTARYSNIVSFQRHEIMSITQLRRYARSATGPVEPGSPPTPVHGDSSDHTPTPKQDALDRPMDMQTRRYRHEPKAAPVAEAE